MDKVTDAQIDKVIQQAGGDIRKVAAAYIRASRRAKSANTAFDLMERVADLQTALYTSKGMDQ